MSMYYSLGEDAARAVYTPATVIAIANTTGASMMEATTVNPAGMPMGLNIKNEEAQHLATELAALTGETLTRAVIVALRERIARLRQQHQVDDLIARAQEIIRQSGGAAPYDNHAALLYDEQGLPK